MRRLPTSPTRVLALILSLALFLPSPALALRQTGLEESDRTKKELADALRSGESDAVSVLSPERLFLKEEVPRIQERGRMLQFLYPRLSAKARAVLLEPTFLHFFMLPGDKSSYLRMAYRGEPDPNVLADEMEKIPEAWDTLGISFEEYTAFSPFDLGRAVVSHRRFLEEFRMLLPEDAPLLRVLEGAYRKDSRSAWTPRESQALAFLLFRLIPSRRASLRLDSPAAIAYAGVAVGYPEEEIRVVIEDELGTQQGRAPTAPRSDLRTPFRGVRMVGRSRSPEMRDDATDRYLSRAVQILYYAYSLVRGEQGFRPIAAQLELPPDLFEYEAPGLFSQGAATGLEEQGKPAMKVVRKVAPLEQRVAKAREMLKAPVERGSKWMRVAAGMRKASEFHWRWRRTTEERVTARFAGRGFLIDVDALWKAAAWFRGSDASVESLGGPMEEPFTAQYERRGRFVAEERDGVVRVTDFIPSPSYAVDPLLTGYGAEVEAAQQGTLPLGVLIDREVERELGISDDLYQIPDPADVLLINAHSHPSWSRYPDGPSEGDQKLKMKHGAELVYGIERDVWNLFSNDSIEKLPVPPGPTPKAPAQAGLEEDSAILGSGRSWRELAELERALILRALEQTTSGGRSAEAGPLMLQKLDPGGALAAQGKKVWLAKGLGAQVRMLMEGAGVAFDDVLVSFIGSVPPPDGPVVVVMDQMEALRLSNLDEPVRQQWLQRVARPAVAVQPTGPAPAPTGTALAPTAGSATDLITAAFSPKQPERQLPAVVQQAMVSTELVVPKRDQRYMLTLLQEGKRTQGELTLAVRLAADLQVTPGQILVVSQKNALTVRMAGDLVELSRAVGHHADIGHLARWMKKIYALERGEGPRDRDSIEGWNTLPAEIKDEAIDTLSRLVEFWKDLRRTQDGGEEISFDRLLELYELVRSVDETEDAVMGLFEHELSRREVYLRWPYSRRLDDLMQRIRDADGNYSSDFLDMFQPEPEDYGGEEAGLEEGAGRTLLSLGAVLTAEQRQVIDEAIGRLMKAKRTYQRQSYGELPEGEERQFDPDGQFKRGGVLLLRGDLFNEWVRTVAAEKGVPFPPDFLFSYPWKVTRDIQKGHLWEGEKIETIGEEERRVLFVDTAVIQLVSALPEEVRRSFVRRLLSGSADADPAAQWGDPAARALLDLLHQKSGRTLAHSIPPDLGWNLRRKAPAAGEAAQEPEVLMNVWAAQTFMKGRGLRAQREAFIQRWGLPGEGELSKRIRALLEVLSGALGPVEALQVNLAAGQEAPIRFEPGGLTVDASLLSLNRTQLKELAGWAREHLNRSNAVMREEPVGRELVAYFEDALVLVKEPARIRTLLSALEDLERKGWNTQPQAAYLQAVERAAGNLEVQKGIDLTQLPLSEHLNKRRNQLSALMGELTTDEGLFLPAAILEAATGSAPADRVLQDVRAHSFQVPKVQEVAHLMAVRSELSAERALEILGGYHGLLVAARTRGLDKLVMHLAYRDLPEVLADLRRGRSSWVYQSVSGDRDPRVDANEEFRFNMYDSAVQEFALLDAAFGGSGGLRLSAARFPALRPAEWNFLLAQIRSSLHIRPDSGWKGKAMMGFPYTPPPILQPWEVFLNRVRATGWKGGPDLLRAGGDTAGLVQLMNEIQRAVVYDHKRSTDILGNPAVERFGDFKRVLVEMLVGRWGVALGSLLRAGRREELEIYFQSYAEQMKAAVAQASSAAWRERGAILEAVYLAAAELKMPLSKDLAQEAREITESAWPAMLGVEPTDPSDFLAVERAALRYLIAVGDSETLEALTGELARYVQGRKRVLPAASGYAWVLLKAKAGKPEALAAVARFLLLQLGRQGGPAAGDRMAQMRLLIDATPAPFRKEFLTALLKTPAEFEQLLSGVGDPRMKRYLLGADPVLAAEHLKHLDVGTVGAMLAGLPPREIQQVTARMQQGRRGPDILAREVYEGIVDPLPATLESNRTSETLPNHYAVLGLPRSATADEIKKSVRHLSFLYHPDRFYNEGKTAEDAATARFKRIQDSYKVLSDVEKRREYNLHLPNKVHLYPRVPWYQQIPPEVDLEELERGSQQAGLEERVKEPTQERMREALRKLKIGTRRQRELVLKWLSGWILPEMHPEIARQGRELAQALVLNLRFPYPEVRHGAGRLLVMTVQSRQIPPEAWAGMPAGVASLLAHPQSYVREDARRLLLHMPQRGPVPMRQTILSVIVPLLKEEDPERRLFAFSLFARLIREQGVDGAQAGPGLATALAGIEDPSSKVRAAAQRVVNIAFDRGWVGKEELPRVLTATVENVRQGEDSGLRTEAAQTLLRMPEDLAATEPFRSAVLSMQEAVAPGPGRGDPLRVAFLVTLGALAAKGRASDAHPPAISPTLTLLTSYPDAGVRRAAQRYVSGMIQGGIAPAYAGQLFTVSLTGLSDPESGVRREAQRTLLRMGTDPQRREMVVAAMPAILGLRDYPNEGTREVVRELLVALSAWEVFRDILEAGGIGPADLGLRTDLNWRQLGPLVSVWNQMIVLEPYEELTLGARAVLRRVLTGLAQSSPAPDALLSQARSWVGHLARLEALDRALGLPTAGAELHVPFETAEEEQRLHEAAARMASDVGPHVMVPAQREGTNQVDLRLLPAYPAVFTQLLRLFLETPEMQPYFSWVAAHYTIRADLRGDLAVLALALFYGEMTYPWLPVPRGRAAVGFPGPYIYRGATFHEVTGDMMPSEWQMNLNLRPFVVLKAISLGRGEPIYQPQELFPEDVENYVWLARAAKGRPRSEVGLVFEQFRARWRQWLSEIGPPELAASVAAAEKAVGRSGGAGVSDLLDKASARIYEGLYGISPEAVASQEVHVPSAQSIARAQPRREELAQSVKEAVEGAQGVLIPDAEARRALLAYRRARTLEDLDKSYPSSVKTLVRALWADERPAPDQEAQLLELLEALDSDQAQRIREGLGSLSAQERRPPSTAGLEEMPALISDLHRYSVRVSKVLHRADLVTTLELLATPLEEVKALKGLGATGLLELEEALGGYGLRFQNSEELSSLLGMSVDSPSSAHNVAHVVRQIASPDPLTSVLAMHQIRRWLPPGSPGITSLPRRLVPNLFQQLLSPNNGVSQSGRRLLIRLAAYPQFQPSLRNLLGGLPWSLNLWPDLADSIAAIANRQSPPQWPSVERVSPTSDLGQAATRLRAWLEEAARAPSMSVVGISPERARQQEAALRALAPVLPESLRERLVIVTGDAAEADRWTERQLFASSELALVAERLAQRFGREGEGIPLYYHATEGEAAAMRDALVIWDLERRFRLVPRGREADLRSFLRELLANLQGVPLEELQGQALFEQAVSDAELLVGA